MIIQISRPETEEEFEEYYALRWRILRAPWGQPRGSEQDEFEAAADHLTARDQNGRLLGVGRLHLNSADEAQIRYMATGENCRHCGVGRALCRRLEQLAIDRGADRLVLNAREDVVGFYERAGFEITGPGPVLYDVIRHSTMVKRLKRY